MIEDKKIKLLYSCINLCVTYVASYSIFLSESLATNIESYIKHINTNKKNSYLKKIINNLDKVVMLEDKKYNENNYNKLIIDLNKKIDRSFEKKVIDKKYRGYLKKHIDKKSFYNILTMLLDEYYEYGHKEKIVIPKMKTDKVKSEKKVEEIVLPSLKKYDKPYILDKHGLKIYHLRYEDNKIVFNDDTFLKEKSYFKECIKKDVDKLFTEEEGLSTFEKKRRIYLQSLFKVYKSLDKLKRIDLDQDYPLQDCYDIANTMVDCLFDEMHDFTHNKKDYTVVSNFTIKTYGYNNLVKEYEKLYKYMDHMLVGASGTINKTMKNNAIAIKTLYQYKDFKESTNIIPSIEDILEVYNRRVINNVAYNYKKYLGHTDIFFKNICKHMTDEDLVQMYFNIKDCVIKFSINNLLKDLIALQNKFGKFLSIKKKISFEQCVSEYFSEDVLSEYI